MASFNIIQYPIVINNSNVVSNSNNSIYRYNFPQGSVKFENSKVAVSSVSIYYSWYNISSVNSNNVYQYVWYYNGSSTTFTITMPDGFYDISGINAYLQSQMIANGTYLVDANGNYVYYLEFVANATYYSIQFNSFPIPTSLPTGYSNPGGLTFPVTTTTPQIIISATNFRNNIGFNAGTYPNPVQTTTYSKLSDFTPQITAVESILLSCSLLNNKYSNPSTVLYSFSPAGTGFGSVIQSNPTFQSYISVQDGNYASFDIQFLDQNFNRLVLQDNNLTVILLIGREDIVAIK